jgi:AcrR family transcriptional regulator
LFIARGLDDVTIAEVAAAADVSVNTVFNYFSTKEDLLFGACAMACCAACRTSGCKPSC